jgi:hypothetical protein
MIIRSGCFALLTFLGSTAMAQSGPTIGETKAWLETEGKALFGGSTASRIGGMTVYSDSWVTDVQLNECTLALTQAGTFVIEPKPKHDTTTYVITIPLKDLDVNGIAIEPATDLIFGSAFFLRVPTTAAAGKTIRRTGERAPEVLSSLVMTFDHERSASRIAAAVRRAAMLCGAKAEPF